MTGIAARCDDSESAVGDVKALLLAAGLGKRLRPLTLTTPKCLVPIAGRPLLDYWFDRFAEASIHDVLINTHHLPELVRRYIEVKNAAGRVHAAETFEPQLLGSAGTVHANRAYADVARDILIVYADNLSMIDLSQALRFHAGHADPLTMALFHTPYPSQCGIAELDGDARITAFVEKPSLPQSDLANAGLYIVRPDAYREIADMAVFDMGFDVLPAFVGRMRGWVWNGYHRDIGSLDSLQQAERDVAEGLLTRRSSLPMKKAVFLDRDGVLIEDVDHLTDPKDVRLIAGAAEAIRAFQRRGYACVVVTNQSVIGRGMLTVEGLEEVHAEMYRQLRLQGVELDGLYYCPVRPTQDDPTVVEHPDRKPGPGMLLRAARYLGLDVSQSWMVGDSLSDMLAGRNAGCRGAILVQTGHGRRTAPDHESVTAVAADLLDAVSVTERLEGAAG